MIEQTVPTPVPRLGRSLRVIDNTALASYMTCPREYFYSMVLHRRPEGRSPALVFGTAWHKALEVHYKTNGDRHEVARQVIDSWEGHDSADDYRTLARVLLDYESYATRFGLPESENAKTVGWPDAPMVEMAVNLDDDDLLHPYAGKLDRLVEIGGLVYVEDHKTTSRLDKNYFKQYDNSNQMLGYHFLGKKLLPSRNVVGVRLNVAHVLTNKTEFIRELFNFSPDRLAEWKVNYNTWIRRLGAEYDLMQDKELVPGTDYFPGHYGDNGCSRKFGMCGYHEVCSMPLRLRMEFLEREYELNPWNPLENNDD